DDLLVFILHTWQERYGLSEDEYRPFLLQYLEAGRALVLLDALDETAVGQSTEVAEESYLRVSRAILRFTTRFEQALFALTARKAGYHKRARLPGFSELEVLDYRIEEIAQFVHKWFRAYTPPAKHGLADRLLRELKMRVHLQSLAANPLLLSLIALDYEANLELPDDRARLYDECIEILLRRWDADRLIVRARAFRPEFQKQILPEIAWHFNLRGLRFFTRAELLPLIADFLKQKRIDPGEAAGVLADIVTENGLLREQAHEVYGFLHLTLQEYFAASYLSERHQLKRLLTYLGDPWWEEVILLYAGHTFDASPLLTHLLQSAGEGVAAEDIFFSKLQLAGRCLATHPRLSDPALYDQTCQRLLDLFAHASYTNLCRQAAAALVEIARSDPNGEVWQRMLEMLKSEEAEKPARVFSEEENLQHMLLTAIANLGGAELHRALLPPLLQGAFPERIAEGAATLLRALKDETIEQEVFLRLEDQRVALNMRAPLIHAVGSMDNPASIQRLLAFHNG